ncbi:MAG TPA: thiol:disulfide interchange protein [Oceanospirillales bacterium]|nr:thiol:disulfide interchange protein [Oceanospirillaceae bacterium]HBS42743.1 thiol:disulfide interchange protein [Oceanospirillales bacterium]|tara:strand:+ start:14816 stop:16552 length:1737 start_codon:yes stop_codon:yes gene_type:complete
MRRVIQLLFLTLATLTAASGHASLLDSLAPETKTFLPVEEAFPLSVETAPGTVTAHWTNPDGYYLYQHRIYIKQGDNKLSPVSWSKDGKEKFDEAFGDIVAYYGDLDAVFDTSGLAPGDATLWYQGCADAGLCYPPQKYPLTLLAATAANTEQAAPVTGQDNFFSGRSAIAVAGLFFLLGLGLTFTPCVLPMVPILTSVVLGQKNTSPLRGFLLSSVYVLGMAITYAAAGLAVGLLGAGANIQAWMQDPVILSVFAVFFVLLALAMFGLYELQLPAGLRNRLNNVSQKQQGGHFVSVFIIGVLSALVVSPCVSAPLAGALAYLSTTGDAVLGGTALLAMGLGMGTPLIILGTTGASVLPKAGMWMNRIKYLFGFMLIGVAIWLVGRILPEALVLALWGALAAAAGIAAGALSSAQGNSQKVLKVLGLLLFIYGVIAIAGAVKGHTDPFNPLGDNATAGHESPFYQTDSVAEVMDLIRTAQQPVMLDLYADWCISCRVMEKEIFATEEAQQALSGYHWVQLDLTDNTQEQRDFLQQQAVFGPPTVLFFTPGSEAASGRIVGEREREDFLREAGQLTPGH